jgi:hypothetical protein
VPPVQQQTSEEEYEKKKRKRDRQGDLSEDKDRVEELEKHH